MEMTFSDVFPISAHCLRGASPPPLVFTCAHLSFPREGRRTHIAILWTLIIGLIAGALAKLFMPGKDPGGIVITMLLGIAGSFLAGFLLRAVGHGGRHGYGGAGIIGSIIGAMIILGIYRLIVRRRHTV